MNYTQKTTAFSVVEQLSKREAQKACNGHSIFIHSVIKRFHSSRSLSLSLFCQFLTILKRYFELPSIQLIKINQNKTSSRQVCLLKISFQRYCSFFTVGQTIFDQMVKARLEEFFLAKKSFSIRRQNLISKEQRETKFYAFLKNLICCFLI